MAFNWRKFPWTNLHDLNLDWIIQTVKTLEENLADAIALMRTTAQNVVDSTISALLTGDGDFTVNKNGNVSIAGNRVQMNGNPVQIEGVGDLTVNKTGDVNLTGNNVRITSGSQAQMIGGAFISDGGQQLTLHNPNSSTNMTANYNSGVLHLTNNQNFAEGVAVYPIKTPADGGGDNSSFSANVGYVKTAVEAEASKLRTVMLQGTWIEANNGIQFDGIPDGSTAYGIIQAALESGRSPILCITNVAGDWDTYLHLSRYDWNDKCYEFTSFEIQVPSTVVCKRALVYASSASYLSITK